jgi:hypothetical protein
MAVGETLFERVTGERIICKREEATYQSLVAFYTLADARVKKWLAHRGCGVPREGR